jgi:tRNA threonylcarbamoyladenosine biosynthesis protein TsaE
MTEDADRPLAIADLPDLAATRRLAERLALALAPGDVVALVGALGAGKSELVRAVVRAMTGDPTAEVPSPTFTLVQTYDTPRALLWHFDLYRLEGPEEARELGLEEAFEDGIALIEWPDRLGSLLPRRAVVLRLTLAGGAGDARRCALLPGDPPPPARLVAAVAGA